MFSKILVTALLLSPILALPAEINGVVTLDDRASANDDHLHKDKHHGPLKGFGPPHSHGPPHHGFPHHGPPHHGPPHHGFDTIEEREEVEDTAVTDGEAHLHKGKHHGPPKGFGPPHHGPPKGFGPPHHGPPKGFGPPHHGFDVKERGEVQVASDMGDASHHHKGKHHGPPHHGPPHHQPPHHGPPHLGPPHHGFPEDN